jgi:glutathione S-transferase
MLTLYSYPGACALVSHIALHMTGAEFVVEYLDLLNGEQRTPEYLAINPRGKVPALVTDQGTLTENLAIILYLDRLYPAAKLLPDPDSPKRPTAPSDLSWFASGVHPHMTRLGFPARFSDGCHDSVREKASAMLAHEFSLIDARLASRTWWWDEPSAADAYIFWLWARTGDFPLDRSPFRNYAEHAKRMLDLPATQSALARERAYAPCYENVLLQ